MSHSIDQPIQVLLADDHPALRVGLRTLLDRAAGITVVDETADGEQTLARLEALEPDVVVLDCQLPRMSGPAVARAVREQGLATRVVALSAHPDEAYVRAMVEAGAVSYVLKDEAPTVIVEAVRAAADGRGWFSQEIAPHVAALARGERPGGLTARELEVLRHIAAGQSNKHIARALDITERTVTFHVSNILRKLGLGSRVEAALWARDHGIGGVDQPASEDG